MNRPIETILAKIDSIDWANLTDAYGPAVSVPQAIRDLLATDSETRAGAAWNLSGTIYHQGDIFDSTDRAVPLLLHIACMAELSPNRDLIELVRDILESSTRTDEKIRNRWEREFTRWPGVHHGSPESRAIEEITDTRNLRLAFFENRDLIEKIIASWEIESPDLSTQIKELANQVQLLQQLDVQNPITTR